MDDCAAYNGKWGSKPSGGERLLSTAHSAAKRAAASAMQMAIDRGSDSDDVEAAAAGGMYSVPLDKRSSASAGRPKQKPIGWQNNHSRFQSPPCAAKRKYKRSSSCCGGHSVLGLLCCLFAFTIFVQFALSLFAPGHRTTWSEYGHDVLYTDYPNLVIHSGTGGESSHAVYTNSEQEADNYVRYGDFVELVTSSIDLTHDERARIEVHRQSPRSRKRAAVFEDTQRSLDEAIAGESRVVNTYHQRLVNHSRSDGEHVYNLASIDAISKARYRPGVRDPHVYGKLSFATFKNGAMVEAMTIDADNAHARVDNFFAKKDLFVGDDVFLKVNKRGSNAHERNLYLPVLSISSDVRNDSVLTTANELGDNEDIDVRGYENNLYANRIRTQALNETEHSLNVGSADIDHVNVLSERSVVMGVYSRSTTHADDFENHDRYEPVSIFNADGVFEQRPAYTHLSGRDLATDERLASNVVDLSSNDLAREKALKVLSQLRVKKYDVLDPYGLDAPLRHHGYKPPVREREKMSVLAQDVAHVLPHAVREDSIKLPVTRQHSRARGTSTTTTTTTTPADTGASDNRYAKLNRETKPSDFEVVFKDVETKTVDKDSLFMYLILAMQEQQRIIEQMQVQLRQTQQQK